MATPASATQQKASRLEELSWPEATSFWNRESQNCVPACTFSCRVLRQPVGVSERCPARNTGPLRWRDEVYGRQEEKRTCLGLTAA